MSARSWTSTAGLNLNRTLAVGAGLLAAAVLAGCASGSARPKPADLPPNAALIGVRQAWTARVPAANFPLQVRVVGNQVMVAGSDGSLVTLDANTGGEVARASAGAQLSAGVGSDGTISAVVTRDNAVIALEGDQARDMEKALSESPASLGQAFAQLAAAKAAERRKAQRL